MSGQLSAASGQLFWVWLLWLLAFHLPFWGWSGCWLVPRFAGVTL